MAQDETNRPAAAKTGEWVEYKRFLNLLANAYERHLDALNKLRTIRETRLDFQQKSHAWLSFSEPPPYSIDFVDDQWKQVRLKDREIESAQLELDMLESMIETQRRTFQTSAQNSEALESVSSEQ